MDIIRMTEEHYGDVFEMMKIFYSSPAVLSNGSEEIFRNDIKNCISDDPYSEGFVFADGEKIIGYAMIAKSFSAEFGRHCIWIEDLYLCPEERNRGYGQVFLNYIAEKFPKAVLRLEVEKENEHAMYVYEKCGFEELPYTEMIKHSKGQT